jgi:hypothetical protein
MLELDAVGWAVVIFCAFLVGVAKSGVPGLAIMVVPLMAMVLPAKQSVGVLLGILVIGDIFAAGYYRRHANWGHVMRLLPAAFAGIVAGYFLMKVVSNEQLRPMIGVVVLVMLSVNYWRNFKSGLDSKIPTGWWFAVSLGFLAGVTSMMANAAGPISIIYLLAMRLDKMEFVGTSAWFFFIVNWLKVPFNMSLESMTAESIKFNLVLIPAVAVGAIVGILVLRKMPQKAFVNIIQILAAASAVKLIF